MLRTAPWIALIISGCSLGMPEESVEIVEAPSFDTGIAPRGHVEPLFEELEMEARGTVDQEVGDEAVDEGDVEVVVAPSAVPSPSFVLARGETPAHFSRWSGVPIEEIASASDLQLGGVYPVGTVVVVPGANVDDIESERIVHRGRRVADYLTSRGGSVGTTEHTVRTGDTAWTIAAAHDGIPVWLVEAYNPSTSLDRLYPGQILELPILADTVAEADVP